MNLELLKTTLRFAEGERMKPYTDTVGKLTIGVGRCLTDKGITAEESDRMLEHDVNDVEQQVRTLACWTALSDVRQRVIAEMCFQLGFTGVRAFRGMFAAIDEGNFALAADEMLDSKWANQVPGRAHRLSQMMRTNQDVI